MKSITSSEMVSKQNQHQPSWSQMWRHLTAIQLIRQLESVSEKMRMRLACMNDQWRRGTSLEY